MVLTLFQYLIYIHSLGPSLIRMYLLPGREKAGLVLTFACITQLKNLIIFTMLTFICLKSNLYEIGNACNI